MVKKSLSEANEIVINTTDITELRIHSRSKATTFMKFL